MTPEEPPPKLGDSPLTEADVRAMVRLLGEVAADQGGHNAQKRRLVEGLCRLVDADSWAWGFCSSLEPGKQPVYIVGLHGGFEPARFARLMSVLDHPGMAAIMRPFAAELALTHAHLTRLVQQVVCYDEFSRTLLGRMWQDAGVGPIVLSYRPLDESTLSCVVLYRRPDRPLFGPRESRIVHIVASEVPWLHNVGWPEDRAATVPFLAPRPRTVLNLLLCGMNRKEIAANLNISEHTANDYVKLVFRHFGIHSQAALMHRFFSGDGGDRPTQHPLA